MLNRPTTSFPSPSQKSETSLAGSQAKHLRKMASITMTASFPSTTGLTGGYPRIAQRRVVVANAAEGAQVESVRLSGEIKRECNNGRRELMFAAAAAAVCSIGGVAAADQPKPGTPEAKKFYAPICVAMPTAKVCHK